MTGSADRGRRPSSPVVELVTIGNELLLGETVDGNSAWLGRRLASIGVKVVRRATVADDATAIQDAVRQAMERTGTVLCTGGLGPTRDDLTKPAVAELFGQRLVLDEDVLDAIRRRFERRGRVMPEVNRTQAEVPERAVVLPNPVGTAPGLVLEDDQGRMVVLLPGVPREMHALVDDYVLDVLRDRWPEGRRSIRHRVLRTTGIPESELAERVDDLVATLEPLTAAFLPSPVGVDLRLTSWGTLDDGQAARTLAAAEARLRERIGDVIYGVDDEDLVDVVARELTGRDLTLAVAESCTGGLIAKRLTDRPGASAFLLAGVVSYANGAKERFLGVRPDTLRAHGAVSAETAREMVDGVRRHAGADAGVAVTGIAGPGGGSPEKPVGTVWLAAAVGDRVRVEQERFPGDRAEVRARSAQAALALLWRLLREEGA